MQLAKCQTAGQPEGGQGGMGYAAPEDDDDDDNEDEEDKILPPVLDACASIPQDQCSQQKGISACLDKLSHCESMPSFKQVADGLRAMETQYCSAAIRCPMFAAKCMCKVQGPEGFKKICSVFEEVDGCLESVPEECYNDAVIGAQLQFVRDMINAYSEIVCDRKAGGCPEAVACLSQLSARPSPPGGAEGAGNAGPPLPDMPNLEHQKVCTTLPVYECLNTASRTCSIDQGTVTMTQIKIETNELCTGTMTKSASVLEKCMAFTECLTTFEYFPDFLKTPPSGMPDSETITEMLTFISQTTRSGFWCSWIRKYYECAILNAVSCKLPQDVVTAATKKNETLSTMCVGAAIYAAQEDTGDAATVQKSAPLFALIAAAWVLHLH